MAMMCGRSGLFVCLALTLADARSLKVSMTQQRISPTLDPASSKKFFKKDYPSDERPKVDVLHFKHPYPVVQDSGEFDADYVKDENSDNGHLKAQQEYDRLRHKLAKEKKQAADALDKRLEEEGELKRSMEKYEQAVADNKARIAKQKADDAAEKQAEIDAAEKEAKKHAKQEKKEKAEPAKGWWSWSWWPWNWPKLPESTPTAAPEAPAKKEGLGVRSAQQDTEQAMRSLEDCQDELAKARDELKKLNDELAQAKGTQSEANAALDQANKKQLETEKLEAGLTDATSKEEKEHAKAEAAYLEQKRRVDKLKAELDAAAAKVKAQRDAADKGGGVYNTPPAKSLTISTSSPQVMVALLATALASFVLA